MDSGLESGVDGDILWRCLMWSIPIWLTFLHCKNELWIVFLGWVEYTNKVRWGGSCFARAQFEWISRNWRVVWQRESKQTSQLHRNWKSRTIFMCWPDTYLRMGFPLSGNWRVIKAAVIFLCFMGCFLWKSSPLTMVWKLVTLTLHQAFVQSDRTRVSQLKLEGSMKAWSQQNQWII